MAVTTMPRPNLGSSGIIDDEGFRGFGSGGFDEDDLLIIGDEVDNILEGGSGDDKIEGGSGNDTITGGEGNDSLGGGPGDDDLDGQGGNGEKEKDKLFGDAGNDILRAGHGFDELTGGSGNDTFGFYAVGHYQVKDFTLGEDRLFFDAEKTGIDNLEELLSLITGINQTTEGVTVDFGSDASIELVGINLNDIMADAIIFNL